METTHPEPTATRLNMPRLYKSASGTELLPWSHVVERLERAINYWIATSSPAGRPHVTPIWAAWLSGTLYFDGIYTSRWAQNLTAHPSISIHLESGTDVVILEGIAEDTVPDVSTAASIVETYAAKYGSPLPEAAKGMYCLQPRVVRAWTRWPDDATKFTF
jgi:hypothetical protein